MLFFECAQERELRMRMQQVVDGRAAFADIDEAKRHLGNLSQ